MPKEIHKFVTVEMVMDYFGWNREIAQGFLDATVLRGFAIPQEEGKYITKSEKILAEAKHMREILNILQGDV